MVRFVGTFRPIIGEIHEVLYQNNSSYVFDSSKFGNAFDFSGTPYWEEFGRPQSLSRELP